MAANPAAGAPTYLACRGTVNRTTGAITLFVEKFANEAINKLLQERFGNDAVCVSTDEGHREFTYMIHKGVELDVVVQDGLDRPSLKYMFPSGRSYGEARDFFSKYVLHCPPEYIEMSGNGRRVNMSTRLVRGQVELTFARERIRAVKMTYQDSVCSQDYVVWMHEEHLTVADAQKALSDDVPGVIRIMAEGGTLTRFTDDLGSATDIRIAPVPKPKGAFVALKKGNTKGEFVAFGNDPMSSIDGKFSCGSHSSNNLRLRFRGSVVEPDDVLRFLQSSKEEPILVEYTRAMRFRRADGKEMTLRFSEDDDFKYISGEVSREFGAAGPKFSSKQQSLDQAGLKRTLAQSKGQPPCIDVVFESDMMDLTVHMYDREVPARINKYDTIRALKQMVKSISGAKLDRNVDLKHVKIYGDDTELIDERILYSCKLNERVLYFVDMKSKYRVGYGNDERDFQGNTELTCVRDRCPEGMSVFYGDEELNAKDKLFCQVAFKPPYRPASFAFKPAISEKRIIDVQMSGSIVRVQMPCNSTVADLRSELKQFLDVCLDQTPFFLEPDRRSRLPDHCKLDPAKTIFVHIERQEPQLCLKLQEKNTEATRPVKVKLSDSVQVVIDQMKDKGHYSFSIDDEHVFQDPNQRVIDSLPYLPKCITYTMKPIKAPVPVQEATVPNNMPPHSQQQPAQVTAPSAERHVVHVTVLFPDDTYEECDKSSTATLEDVVKWAKTTPRYTELAKHDHFNFQWGKPNPSLSEFVGKIAVDGQLDVNLVAVPKVSIHVNGTELLAPSDATVSDLKSIIVAQIRPRDTPDDVSIMNADNEEVPDSTPIESINGIHCAFDPIIGLTKNAKTRPQDYREKLQDIIDHCRLEPRVCRLWFNKNEYDVEKTKLDLTHC